MSRRSLANVVGTLVVAVVLYAVSVGVALSGPAILTLLGALVTALATLLAALRRVPRGEGHTPWILLAFVGACFSMAGAFWSESRRAQAAEHLLSTVTGGENFCYLTIQSDDVFVVASPGDYPLYDVNVRIVEGVERKFATFATEVSTGETYEIGNLPADGALVVNDVPIDEDDEALSLYFSARNGFWVQSLRRRRLGTRWVTAIKVNRGMFSDDHLLFEKIDPDFPRNAAGENRSRNISTATHPTRCPSLTTQRHRTICSAQACRWLNFTGASQEAALSRPRGTRAFTRRFLAPGSSRIDCSLKRPTSASSATRYLSLMPTYASS